MFYGRIFLWVFAFTVYGLLPVIVYYLLSLPVRFLKAAGRHAVLAQVKRERERKMLRDALLARRSSLTLS